MATIRISKGRICHHFPFMGVKCTEKAALAATRPDAGAQEPGDDPGKGQPLRAELDPCGWSGPDIGGHQGETFGGGLKFISGKSVSYVDIW